MDLTTCPECGRPAEVEWRDVLESTDGPVEHARIACVDRHWFLLPVTMLSRGPQSGELPRMSLGASGQTSTA